MRGAPGRASLALFVLLLLPALAPPAAGNDATLPDWTGAVATKVAEGLAGPMDFDFAPDGSIWYAEVYGGNVTRLDPRTGAKEVKFTVDIVRAFDERGLVGLALDPQFASNGAFYIYYTKPDPAKPDGGTNRLSKVVGGQEQVLVDNITAFKRHNGGRIAIANDGTLFVSVGDNEKGSPAQDPGSPLGKILHVTRDGAAAPDNQRGLVYSLGHRNIYGLAVHPKTGQLFATENSVGRRDEVNLIEPWKNYGWPICEGAHLAGKNEPCTDGRYTNPLMAFYDNRTAAPTGAAFFLGQLFWASWNEGSVHHLWRDDSSQQWRDRIVFQAARGTRIADLVTAPDGRSLYFSTWSEIWRIEFPSLPPGVEQGHFPPWAKPGPPGPTANQPPPADGNANGSPDLAPTANQGGNGTGNGTGPRRTPLGAEVLLLAVAGAAMIGLRRR